MIGLSEHYRRKRLGIRLLNRLMEYVGEDWGPVPDVWAYVSRTNRYSHPMLEAAGFIWMWSLRAVWLKLSSALTLTRR